MFQFRLKYVFLLVSFCFISCQDILECVINRRPELPQKSFNEVFRGNYYYEELRAEIKNETQDDLYDYFFSISGNLPEGLDYFEDFRTIIFEGNPVNPGTYSFTVHLYVNQTSDYFESCESQFNDCDGLCKDNTSKSYTIIVK